MSESSEENRLQFVFYSTKDSFVLSHSHYEEKSMWNNRIECEIGIKGAKFDETVEIARDKSLSTTKKQRGKASNARN